MRVMPMHVLRVVDGVVAYFFFFKQKTAYEMRISDWSSDVCSSDLELDPVQPDVGDDARRIEFEEAALARRRRAEGAAIPAHAAVGVDRRVAGRAGVAESVPGVRHRDLCPVAIVEARPGGQFVRDTEREIGRATV